MNIFDVSKVELKLAPCGLGRDMYVEYFGMTEDAEYFIIARPREKWDYCDFICLRGSPTQFRSVKVKEVTRYRDGGITTVNTEEGKFHFPTPFQPELKATFNGEKVHMLPNRDKE